MIGDAGRRNVVIKTGGKRFCPFRCRIKDRIEPDPVHFIAGDPVRNAPPGVKHVISAVMHYHGGIKNIDVEIGIVSCVGGLDRYLCCNTTRHKENQC